MSDAAVEDSDNWFVSNPPLDFVTGPAYTLSLSEKYTCLNTTKNSSSNDNVLPESHTSNYYSSTLATYGTLEEASYSPVLQQHQRSSDSTV